MAKTSTFTQDPYASGSNPFGVKRPSPQATSTQQSTSTEPLDGSYDAGQSAKEAANTAFQQGSQSGYASQIGAVNAGNANNSPYRGGLMQNFDQFGTSAEGLGRSSAYGSDNDSDVKNAQAAYYNMNHGDAGSSHNEQAALYNLYRGRIGTKNALSEQIGALPGQLSEEENLLKLNAGHELGQGLKSTRENYNHRGLLYSGMREGAEQQKKGQAASMLSSGLMGARRESANSQSKAEEAYAAVGLANQQESVQLANQAFETAHANQIARLQGMQQLGSGLGYAAGMYAGSRQPSSPMQSGQGIGEETSGPGAGRSLLMQGAY